MTRAILALDGGGVRGIVSVAFLERIEALLGEAVGRSVRIADAFDLVGGTSTGAIIATALALGMRADEVRDLYLSLGPKVFRKSAFRLPGWAPVFDATRLKAELLVFCGERNARLVRPSDRPRHRRQADRHRQRLAADQQSAGEVLGRPARPLLYRQPQLSPRRRGPCFRRGAALLCTGAHRRRRR
jgi:hypothetical protein